jgi:urease accessory protein
MNGLIRLAVVLAFLTIAPSAIAHDVVPGVRGFYGGLLHPLLVPTHLLALVALGLFIGQQPHGQRIALTITFIIGLAVGLAAIASAVGETLASEALTIGTGIAGVLVVLATPPPRIASSFLLAATGASLGLDSPPNEVLIRLAIVALIGTGLGATILLMALTAGVTHVRGEWQLIGVRVVGSWVAASAILVLALRLAR